MNRIGDYGMIGDCHSLALVGPDGSIDWLCFPRFDSPSVFARMLDEDAGHFRVAPAAAGAWRCAAPTCPRPTCLETTFVTADGVLELTDCMPVRPFDEEKPTAVDNHASVLRRVRCRSGRSVVVVDLRPRFEYGTVLPRFTAASSMTAAIVGGPDALWVRASRELDVDRQHISAQWDLAAGRRGLDRGRAGPRRSTARRTTAR